MPRDAAYAPVTREEARAIFDRLDRDSSGHLSAAEVQHALQTLKLPATSAAVDDFLTACGGAGSGGGVSFDTFFAYFARKEAELQAIFASIDKDRDGRLTIDEVQRARKQLGLSDNADLLQRVFNQIDADGSGGIEFTEWRTLFSLIPSMGFDDLLAYWERTPLSSEDVHVPDDVGQKKASPGTVFVCGGVAGAVSRTATAPLDRLRTLLVLQGAAAGAGPAAPRGVAAGLRAIYGEGGVRGFYRGNLTNVLKICPENGVKWIAFEYLSAYFKAYEFSSNKRVNSVACKFISGASAGMLAQLCVYPLECIKTRLSAAAKGYYAGIGDCAVKTLRADGIRGFYRGLGPAMVGMIPYAGVDLTVYASLKECYQRMHPDKQGEQSSVVLLGCGVASCITAQFASYPLGLVRSRLQAQGMSPDRPRIYNGALDCLRQTVRAKGFLGLYDGMAPTMLKVVPAAAISYVAYENCKRSLGA